MESTNGSITIASALTRNPSEEADALCESIAASLDGRRVDLALLLASPHFLGTYERLAERILERCAPRAFIGTTAEAVLADAVEYEDKPAAVLWAAHLPRCKLASFHLSQEDLLRLQSSAELHEHLSVPGASHASFVVLGDPFSIDILELLNRLDNAYPGSTILGGMASAGSAPGENRLVFDGHTLRHGLSGVALWGDLQVDAVVSQGCRPIGRPLVVTRCEGPVVNALGGSTSLDAFRDTLESTSRRDIDLARERGLFVGRVINESQAAFGRGDFLIGPCLGFDQESGAMALDDTIRPGQTIQFHVRDAQSADEDLKRTLAELPPDAAAGALLFTCNGRGTRLFEEANHDAAAVSRASGGAPLAGMFCAGEIGPVGNRSFLHGHTASIALFRARGGADA